MKKLLSIISACTLLVYGSVCVKADASINYTDNYTVIMEINNPIMTINGLEVEIDPKADTSPVIINNHTLLPVRSLIENVGGSVNSNPFQREVIIVLEQNTIRLKIDSRTAYINNKEKTLDTTPTIINGRTMLPIRFIAENLGFNVEWNNTEQLITISNKTNKDIFTEPIVTPYENIIIPTSKETELENGFSAVQYNEDYMFDLFLEEGGASSDTELVNFLQNNIVKNMGKLNFSQNAFGCSTVSTKDKNGNLLFGRNFDWYSCNALVLIAKPNNGYTSISTVNTNFIQNAHKSFDSLPENIRIIVSMYAPLDGMNEKGLCAAVLYIDDTSVINQNTDKPDITTTTAIRLILDKAADVDEALELLKQYNMHNSLGMMVHFAISDTSGKSVAVEYINNEMIVTETPVVTNFYLAKGNKQGIGSQQSHIRFDTLINILSQNMFMDMTEVKNALENVSKHNFNDGETTEWSIVYNQTQGIAQYYHRENYDKAYTFKIK